MKRNDLLSPREEQLMDYLWEQHEAQSTDRIQAGLEDKGWNKVTLYRILQGLIDKGYIRISGLERNNTQYLRLMEPAISKEDYTARILADRGIGVSSIPDLVMAILGTDGNRKRSQKENENIINGLEEIIMEIRTRNK